MHVRTAECNAAEWGRESSDACAKEASAKGPYTPDSLDSLWDTREDTREDSSARRQGQGPAAAAQYSSHLEPGEGCASGGQRVGREIGVRGPGRVASSNGGTPRRAKEGGAAAAGRVGGGRGTPRAGSARGASPRGGPARASPRGLPRTASFASSKGEGGSEPDEQRSAGDDSRRQRGKGTRALGPGPSLQSPLAADGGGGGARAQHMVAGAGPQSPAKGRGDVLQGDQGTWSPFFRNQWYELRDRQFSEEISKYMSLFREGIIAKYDMIRSRFPFLSLSLSLPLSLSLSLPLSLPLARARSLSRSLCWACICCVWRVCMQRHRDTETQRHGKKSSRPRISCAACVMGS